MGIRISTDEFGVKVWRNDRHGFPQYSVKLSRMIDDEWVNVYQDVKFRHGVELENGSEIIIDDGFVTMDVWKGKDGVPKGKAVWMILDYHYTTDRSREARQKQRKSAKAEDIPDSFSAAQDEIPF